MMRALLRHDGSTSQIDLVELDTDIRRGLVSKSARLCHVPWTGDRFVCLGDIPELRDAFDAPDSCVHAWFYERRPSAVTAVIVCVIGLMAVFQVVLEGSQSHWAQHWLAKTFQQWSVGFEPTLLDGRWWTPWTAQFSHTSGLHALCNLLLIAYCGHRVERALGPASACAVIAAAMLGGSLAIVGLDSASVVGSSVIAYGLWGAQIAIGLRFGDAIPYALRGRYGLGNLVFFAPLYTMGLFKPDVSHLGHLGGLLGGVVMVFVLSPESRVPLGQQGRQRVKNLLLGGALSVVPAWMVWTISVVPQMASFPKAEVVVTTAGVRLTMPARMAAHETSVAGMRGWIPSKGSMEPVFCDLFQIVEPDVIGGEWLGDWWAVRFDGTATARTRLSSSLGEGWEGWSIVIADASGHRWRVVEHQLQRGEWLIRSGYYLRDADATGVRSGLYSEVLSTMEVGEPPALVQARTELSRNPVSPSKRLVVAEELHRMGRVEDAERLFAVLDARPDAWRWDAARSRLKMWEEYPEVSGIQYRDWVVSFLNQAPGMDIEMHTLGVRWLVRNGDCETARAHVRQLDGDPADYHTADTSLLVTLDAVVAGCAETLAVHP